MLPTLAEVPEIAQPWLVYPDRPFTPTSLVRCPCCGRQVTADTVVDVRTLVGTTIRGGNHQAPRDHDWLCDGGLHLVYHHQPNGWTRSKVYRALGASAAIVLEQRAREIAMDVFRADAKAGRSHRAEQALADARAGLAENTLDLPGTEPPFPLRRLA